jgi:hypothetical protein
MKVSALKFIAETYIFRAVLIAYLVKVLFLEKSAFQMQANQ